MASFLKDEMPWFKHAKLDYMSKKGKKKSTFWWRTTQGQKGSWWGRTSVARPCVVVHKMQVTTTVGPAPTRPLYHSWVVFFFYKKLIKTKESHLVWTTLQHLGIFLNVRFIYKSLWIGPRVTILIYE